MSPSTSWHPGLQSVQNSNKENRLTTSKPEPNDTSATPGVMPQWSTVIDTDYNPLSPNVQHKSNTELSNNPDEMEIDGAADSIGPI